MRYSRSLRSRQQTIYHDILEQQHRVREYFMMFFWFLVEVWFYSDVAFNPGDYAMCSFKGAKKLIMPSITRFKLHTE